MTEPRKKFLLGSEQEETPRGDRLVGLQLLQERNHACEHIVVVGAPGAATLALKMRGQDLCPHCTRREAAYWRGRAKSAEGVAKELGEQVPRAESLLVVLRRLLLRAHEQLLIAQSGIRPGRNTTELLFEIQAATVPEPPSA